MITLDTKHEVEQLTHCGLVASCGDKDLVSNGSSKGLLSDGTKPLPEPLLTNNQKEICVIHLRAISHEVLLKLIHCICSEITLLIILPHFPGATKLSAGNN